MARRSTIDEATANADAVVRAVVDWYPDVARDLPWRGVHSFTPWGVLVSEVMAQQTQIDRVMPAWQTWMERWPDATACANAPVADILRAWGRLGYPRRARWLHQAATVIRDEHDGQVPASLDALRALPGIGEYTAAAVMAFAFGEPTVVLDTNVRRVIDRALAGRAMPATHLTNAEREQAAALVAVGGPRWSQAAMELGALVCQARSPRCVECPVQDICAWRRAGHPAAATPTRRQPSFDGSDRQARGAILHVVRETHGVVPTLTVDSAWPDTAQRRRAIASLIADGLLAAAEGGYRLP